MIIGEDEDDSPRDGFMSTHAEAHALAHGLYAGMRNRHAFPGDLPDNKDVQKEPHYYKGGYFIGTITQLLVVFAFLYDVFLNAL